MRSNVIALPVSFWVTTSLLLLLVIAIHAEAAGTGEMTNLDCGVNALFLLLRLEGRPVTLDSLLSVLTSHDPQGYSMAELIVAARSLGVELEGVEFGKGNGALNRPAIAFFKDAKGGHYAVLRPVGTTGTMVQVIDPPRVPWIVDYDRVFSAKPWTSRILIRRDAWIVRNKTPLLMATVGSSLLLLGFARRRMLQAKIAKRKPGY